MNDKTRALDITIMGRSYKVTCSEEEREPLLEAVAYVDEKMSEIKTKGRTNTSVERVAVMAALNIAHELLSVKATQTAADGFDLDALKRRILSMQATLDQALAPQEKLF